MEAERVGNCKICGKPVYCRDGFLDGVVGDDKELYCHRCFEGKPDEAGASGGNDRRDDRASGKDAG